MQRGFAPAPSGDPPEFISQDEDKLQRGGSGLGLAYEGFFDNVVFRVRICPFLKAKAL